MKIVKKLRENGSHQLKIKKLKTDLKNIPILRNYLMHLEMKMKEILRKRLKLAENKRIGQPRTRIKKMANLEDLFKKNSPFQKNDILKKIKIKN